MSVKKLTFEQKEIALPVNEYHVRQVKPLVSQALLPWQQLFDENVLLCLRPHQPFSCILLSTPSPVPSTFDLCLPRSPQYRSIFAAHITVSVNPRKKKQ